MEQKKQVFHQPFKKKFNMFYNNFMLLMKR
jgi:hypothetical protein